MMLANHKEGLLDIRGVMVTIKRGQVGHSELKLAARWRWSRGKVRRFLKWLKTEHQIEHQKNNVTSLITILNYDRYQGDNTTNGTPNGHQTDTKQYPNKNVKNVKKQNPAQGFTNFWEIYPRKVAKEKTLSAWKIHKCYKIADRIVQSIKDHLGSEQWQKDNGQFIPHPTTYLNQHRWEDEIKPTKIVRESTMVSAGDIVKKWERDMKSK